jgi:transcriptional regulator with XRE-family HTH domain
MQSLLRRRERRGLTWAELSAESGVPRSTLHWWHRRLRSEDPDEGSRFVRLDIAHEVIPADAGEPIEVVARSGHHVLVRSGFDPHSLRQVLEVLDAGC